MSFSDFEYAGKRKQTRREYFLAEMEVVPWAGLKGLIEPFYPKAGGGRKPYCQITHMRQFARLTLSAPIPEDTMIMNFRHLLEKHRLAPA